MSTMNRSTFRNLWLLTMVLAILAGLFMFNRAQDTETRITRAEMRLNLLRNELENAARLSAALAELDALTIDERTATRLNILRHLGLENTDYDFNVTAKQVRQLGDTSLIVRNIEMRGLLTYAQSLALLDHLYNTRKIILNRMQMSTTNDYGDAVEVRLSGLLYGLEKQGPLEQ